MPSLALICAICRTFRSRKDGDYFVSTSCGRDHIFHYFCIKELITNAGKNARCPRCKKNIGMHNLVKMTGVSIAHIASNKPRTMKIATVGSSGVGKSTLVSRYKTGAFTTTSRTSTLGCDMETVTITVSDKIILLRIWDTAGQERYFSMMPSYLRDVDGILLVYDVTSKRSFDDLMEWSNETGITGSWIQTIKELAPFGVEIFLCGNKCDCPKDDREVSKADGQKLANSLRCGFLETSAKENENVDAAFKLLATSTLDKLVRAGLADTVGSTQSLIEYEPPPSNCRC